MQSRPLPGLQDNPTRTKTIQHEICSYQDPEIWSELVVATYFERECLFLMMVQRTLKKTRQLKRTMMSRGLKKVPYIQSFDNQHLRISLSK